MAHACRGFVFFVESNRFYLVWFYLVKIPNWRDALKDNYIQLGNKFPKKMTK